LLYFFFLISCFFNHSCYPNVFKFFHNNANHISFYATRDIKAGEALTFSYIDLNDSYHVRQQITQNTYCFACKCERCEDELNGGHAFDKFQKEGVCQNSDCVGTIIDLPEGINIDGSEGIICQICKTNTPNRALQSLK